MADVKKLIADTFKDIAEGIKSGSFAPRQKIVVTGLNSEHGEDNVISGAVEACAYADVIYIGSQKHDKLKCVFADCEKEAHEKMEKLLEGEAAGAVTAHYPFPVGVSTVGRVTTPARGKEVYIASTTGTSATDRVESMVKNALYGIICAKSCGIENPTVGILNIKGARQTERALKELAQNGYPITFGSSVRQDGGCVLRGNDLLSGACDVIVADSLTGNILIKLLSSFSTGGSYEAVGCGYGPGIGKGFEKLIMIISRASGSPVISGAINYAAQLVKGDYKKVAAKEFDSAEKAGLSKIIEKYRAKQSEQSGVKAAAAPQKETVTEQISGVEITELDDAVSSLWAKGIYAQSGMGCTGPIILVSKEKYALAVEALKKEGRIGG